MLVIGIMSGSSLDGIDLAACTFRGSFPYQFEVLAAETISYSREWEEALQNGESQGFLAGYALHQAYGRHLGTLTNDFQKRYNLQADLISSHGHTLYHQPSEGLSIQIGDASAIAAQTGLPVVHDFRQGDLHLGGTGAPLSPIGDAYLFGQYTACLNLGGIANISYQSPGGERLAFDVAPANQILNHLARSIGRPYDHRGNLARQGHLNPDLLASLNAIPYYQLDGPRSLDKKDIKGEWLTCINSFPNPVTDKLKTYTEHLAQQVGEATKALSADSQSTLLITGGGAWNEFLIERLQAYWPGKVVVPDAKMVDFKEALIFAFMGWLRYQGAINCLSSVTGAAKDQVAGSLYG